MTQQQEIETRVQGRLQAILNSRERAVTRLPGLLGQVSTPGSATVPGLPRHCYVRVGSGETLVIAYNMRTPHANNMAVVVGYDPVEPELFQVLSERSVYPPGMEGPATTGKHHVQHEWGNPLGFDVTFIQPRQFEGCRPYATSPYSLSISISRGVYEIGDVLYEWKGSPIEGNLDLTSHVPSSGWRWVLITMTSTGPAATSGSVVSPLTLADIPKSADPSDWRVAAVLLKAGDTEISDWPDEERITDLRFAGSRAFAASLIKLENCLIVAKSGGNETTVQGGLDAADQNDQVLILNGDWAENVNTPATAFVMASGLVDQHQAGDFGVVLSGADDVGPIVTLDTAAYWANCIIRRALTGGAGDFVGIQAGGTSKHKYLSGLGVHVDGGATGRNVYGVKVGSVTKVSTISRCAILVENAANGAALELTGGDVTSEYVELVNADGNTALLISGGGTYVFHQCRIEGDVTISGAASVTFDGCRIFGDLAVTGSGANVEVRGGWIAGDIAVGSGNTLELGPPAVGRGANATITGAGTVLAPQLVENEAASNLTRHSFGPLAANDSAVVQVQPAGAVSGAARSFFVACFTDYLADRANYANVQVSAFDDGTTVAGLVRTFKSGTGTLYPLYLGCGATLADMTRANVDNSWYFPQVVTIGSVDAAPATTARLRVVYNPTGGGVAVVAYTTLYAPYVQFYRAQGTPASPTPVLADNILGGLEGKGYHSGSAWSSGQALVSLVASENWTATAQGTHIKYETTFAGTTTLSDSFYVHPYGVAVCSHGSHAFTARGIYVSNDNEDGGVYLILDADGRDDYQVASIQMFTEGKITRDTLLGVGSQPAGWEIIAWGDTYTTVDYRNAWALRYWSGSAWTRGLYLSPAGYVGLGGVALPAYWLDLVRVDDAAIRIKNTGADTTPYLRLENDEQVWYVRVAGGSGDAFEIFNKTTSKSVVHVGVGTGQDALRIIEGADGWRFGFGSAADTYLFDVYRSSASNAHVYFRNMTTDDCTMTVNLVGGQVASTTLGFGALNFINYEDSNLADIRVQLLACKTTSGAAANDGRLIIKVHADGAPVGTLTEIARFEEDRVVISQDVFTPGLRVNGLFYHDASALDADFIVADYDKGDPTYAIQYDYSAGVVYLGNRGAVAQPATMVQARGPFATYGGRVLIVNETNRTVTPRDSYYLDDEVLHVVGVTSDLIMAINDGAGRFQTYWNSSAGPSPKFLVAGENAAFLLWSTQTNPLWEWNYADGSAAAAGDAITWTRVFAIFNDGAIETHNSGFQWRLGGFTSGAPTATGYVSVWIGGTLRRLLSA